MSATPQSRRGSYALRAALNFVRTKAQPPCDAQQRNVFKLSAFIGQYMEAGMGSSIERAKGCANQAIGTAKQLAGLFMGSPSLRLRGTCQREKGGAQLVWANELREKEKREAAVRDEMLLKLMGRKD